MKRRVFRNIFLILTAVLTGLLAACARVSPVAEGEAIVPIVTSIPEGYVPPVATEEIMASPTPDQHAGDTFHALDREIFLRYITDNGITFHQMLADPVSFGIADGSLNLGFGDFSAEGSAAYATECAAYLARLTEIPRAELNERDQFSYDVLQQYLEQTVALDKFDYFYEPLTPYNGLHAQIPLALGLFQFRNEQDVKDYLALVTDAPRYLSQVLAYEQKRAELGFFMTRTALTNVLAECKSILDARNSFYLIDTFNTGIASVPGLSAEAVADYQAQNQALITGPFMNAYQSLYDGLNALQNRCREGIGLSRMSERGAAYFELQMQQVGSGSLNVEEAAESIRNELFYLINSYLELAAEHPDAIKDATALSSGSTDSDLSLLKTLTSELLFPLPEHTLTVASVPKELETQLSSAMFVIPPIDDVSQCRILINDASIDNERLLTLAHETYPGHLTQYVYQRSLDDTGLMQRALHFEGYTEGWAQIAAQLAAQNQKTFDPAHAEMRFYQQTIEYALLPALISINVNYYSYDEAGVKSFIQSLGLNGSSNASVYYNLAVDQPFAYIGYAYGYCQLAGMLREAEEDMGERFDRAAYLKAYLDLGPGYFDLVQERMDIWVDANTPE